MRMPQKPASVVLTSLKASTYSPGKELLRQLGAGWVRKFTPRLRHRALTDSRPSANVTLIILRVADLVAALLHELVRYSPHSRHST